MTGLKATDTLALWAGLLAGPVAWSVQMVALYALAPWACDGVTRTPLHVVSLLGLAAAAGGGVVAWRAWRSVGGWPSGEDEASAGRLRLMAVLGLLASVLFAVVMLAQWLAVVILPCSPGDAG